MTRSSAFPSRPIQAVARPPATGRTAFSLAELLVASAIAMVVMAAMAQLFSVFGRSLSQSQSTVDLAGRLRTTAWQLRQDLAGITVDLKPPARPESNSGYFELLEGPARDATTAFTSGTANDNLTGDTDDTLLFTTRSAGDPFVGRFGDGTIESACAEVVWFCREAPDQPVANTTLYNLYRRQLLVTGYVGAPPFSTSNNSVSVGSIVPAAVASGTATPIYDLSLRVQGSLLVPNTLADLTKRENRFMRNGVYQYLKSGATITVSSTAFPYAFPLDAVSNRTIANATFESTERDSEDVILTNVISFDVRVFDPQARAMPNAGGYSLVPGDPGYVVASGTGASGAYVDLGQGGVSPVAVGAPFPPANTTSFQSRGVLVSNSTANLSLLVATYDTWSDHYEYNGVNEDGDTLVDEGTNGDDDDSDSLPDDLTEYETSPPYPVPLRGLEVRIRCYDSTSKQVRQVTIRHSFIKK